MKYSYIKTPTYSMESIRNMSFKFLIFIIATVLTQPSLAQIILQEDAGFYQNAELTIKQAGKKNSKKFTNSKFLVKKANELNYASVTTNKVKAEQEKIYLPANVQAEMNDNDQVVVSWDIPEATEFRFDSGQKKTDIGYNNTNNSILGSVFAKNAVIEEVTWYTTSTAPHDSVTIVILGLSTNNIPDVNQVLYWEKCANTPNSWSSLELDSLVVASDGFFVGIQSEGFTSIGVDSGEDDDWPFAYGVQFGISDYTGSSSWRLLEEMGLELNLMIRAKGFTVGESKNSNSVQSYNIYRINKATENKTNIATGITELTYLDTGLDQLEAGYYYYGVTAMYESDTESDIAYSNEIPNKLHTNFTVNISSTTGESVEGAYVTLVNQEDTELQYGMDVPDGGECLFSSVLMGSYNISVSMMYHAPQTIENVQVSEYGSISIDMVPFFIAPEIFDVVVTDNEALLSWEAFRSDFFDDFESYDDFVINFPPWTSINVDGGTVLTFYSVYFQNQSVPQAGIIYNKKETIPRVGNEPYSGLKYLAVFNAGPTVFNTDKWNIAPKVLVEENYIVSFQATGGNEYYSEEVFQVFVSTGNAVPEEMVAISPVITTPKGTSEWERYTFDLSAYVGQNVHVGIHCTSYDQFYLCVDDFYVGPSMEKNVSKSVLGYNVYLNDMETPVASNIDASEYTFKNLAAGKNTLGVQAIYESGVSEIATKEVEIAVSIDDMTENQVLVYPNPASDKILIESNQAIDAIEVYNQLGCLVYAKSQNDSELSLIQTKSFESGIYLVIIHVGNFTHKEMVSVIKF